MKRSTILVLGVLASSNLFAQEDEINKRASIPLSSMEVEIDGTISAGEWEDASRIDDLYQSSPDEYAPASERTEFFLKYDSDYLYVGVKAYESDPGNIVAKVSRQGAELSDDDRISIMLDPHNSKRAGYRFVLNPNSVRNEGIYVNISEFQSDWTAIWDGRSTRTDYGWSAEMAIPFKSLSFSESTDTWGVNLLRRIARNDQNIGWVSQNRANDASVSGAINGFRDLNQGLGLDVVPSISIVNDRTYNPQVDDHNIEPSVNMFYKVTPSMNASLTFNTDFSATEVDDQQVDIGQFGLFFPEKREFFLREFDIFDFGGIGGSFSDAVLVNPESQNARPFFSRRIGLSGSGETVDIIGGAKLSGKLGRYEIGTLMVKQDEFIPEDPTDPTIDSSTLFVGRVAADVLAESSVGAIFTSGDPRSNNDNSLAGVDFRYRNSRSVLGRVESNFWYQQSDTPGLEGKDAAMGAYLSLPNPQKWRGLIHLQRVEENFNPALGFTSRTGVEFKRGVIGYIHRFSNHPWLQSVYSAYETRQWEYIDDGSLQDNQTTFKPVLFKTKKGGRLELFIQDFGEGVYPDGRQPLARQGITLPYGELDWRHYGFASRTSTARPVDIGLRFREGGYYTGDREAWKIDLGWRPTNKFNLSGSYEYWDVELPEGQFELRSIEARSEWAFNSTLSWVNVLQYNNLNASLGVNSRLHWTPRAGQNVYFVINHNFNEMEDDEFVSFSNEITLKASYTFRF